jgi:uroporphyrinogen III methyltransferase/synthase
MTTVPPAAGRPPLSGRRVLVTRASEQAGALVRLLEGYGAEVVALPTIRIEPASGAALDRAADEALGCDWLVFTSANGATHFAAAFLPRHDVGRLGARVCAVGPATAAALASCGFPVHVVPDEHRGASVTAALLDAGPLSGARVMLPRADIARPEVADDLRRAGAVVLDVVAYHTRPAEPGSAEAVLGMLRDGRIDAVTFSSASTVTNFAAMLGREEVRALLGRTVVAAIGPVTAEAARRLGLDVAVTPATYTIPALVDALTEHLGARPRPLPATP